MNRTVAILLLGFFLMMGPLAMAQNVGVGTTTPDSTAILDITSNSKGVLLPRLTLAQRNAIVNPANGLLIQQTDTRPGLYRYTGNSWIMLAEATVTLQLRDGLRTSTFNYTGSVQKFVVPAGVTFLQADVRGAQGGRGEIHKPSVYIDYYEGAPGGRTTAHVNVKPGDTVYIYVGGKPATATIFANGAMGPGGYNSGGTARAGVAADGARVTPGGGGGASDIRIGVDNLANRALVAGGGGGAVYAVVNTGKYAGGAGGGITGGNGECISGNGCGAGGTQTTGNALGNGGGGAFETHPTGGGGGGYWGGMAGSAAYAAGGGGSGFATASATNVQMYSGANTGNGVVTLTYAVYDTILIFPYKVQGSVPTFPVGSIPYSNGTDFSHSNANLYWDTTNKRLGVGTNTPSARLTVNSTNTGTGTSDWIAASIGGTTGNRVVAGIYNSEATIAAHINNLSNWATLNINPGGTVKFGGLAGAGTRHLVVDGSGNLSTQNITIYSNANATTTGLLSNTDWSVFNNKVGADRSIATVAPLSGGGDLSTDRTLSIAQASAAQSGYLTSTDWNTFNNKFSLPSLTNGSVLFSNGTTIAQNNGRINWDNTASRLRVSSANDGTAGAGYTDWIAASFGGTGGNRVVLGVQNADATVAAHSNDLNYWAPLSLNPGGAVKVPNIAGATARMVIVGADGTLASQPIPTGGDNLGNHTATANINLATHKLVGNSGTTGISIANNGNVSTDAALNVAGAASLASTLNVTGAASMASTLNVTGATTIGGTLTTSGVNTLSNLAGTGNRMVVANESGMLTTQAIPAVGDNLGNHTATTNVRLNNNWVSNDGTAKGIKLTNAGAVGINLASPVGSFDIAKQTQVPNGFASVNSNVVAVAANVNSAAASNVLNANGWNGTGGGPYHIDIDFGAGNSKAVIYFIYSGYAIVPLGNPTPGSSLSYTVTLQGSNDGSSFSTVFTQLNSTSTLATQFGTGDYFNISKELAFANPNQYRYYRLAWSLTQYSMSNTPFNNINIRVVSLDFAEQNYNTTYSSGAFTVLENGNTGVGTNAPTANLDVAGTVRLRNGAVNGALLTSDATGNAVWSSTLPNLTLNTGNITNATITNGLGVGTGYNASNKLIVQGSGGIKISSTNDGGVSNTTDWIASNVGGTAGDRVVSGILNGVATIGAHNNALNSWSDFVISPSASHSVTIGSAANATPANANLATASVLKRNLVVNGSIRQGYYATPVSVPPNNIAHVTWTHNLGYGPIVMMSTDQNGGGAYMDYVNVTTYNNNANETVFVLRNTSGNTATGNLRWILVY